MGIHYLWVHTPPLLRYSFFGAVNYPDVQLPAAIFIHPAYQLFFVSFMLISVVFLSNLALASVYEGWKDGVERLIQSRFRKERLVRLPRQR